MSIVIQIITKIQTIMLTMTTEVDIRIVRQEPRVGGKVLLLESEEISFYK
jgi:hypothetical protein